MNIEQKAQKVARKFTLSVAFILFTLYWLFSGDVVFMLAGILIIGTLGYWCHMCDKKWCQANSIYNGIFVGDGFEVCNHDQ